MIKLKEVLVYTGICIVLLLVTNIVALVMIALSSLYLVASPVIVIGYCLYNILREGKPNPDGLFGILHKDIKGR